MQTKRYFLLILAIASLVGCSDDDDDPVDPGVPEDPRVAAVEVSPGSMTFTAIGQDTRFDAVAYDQYGAVIDTVFTWQSSNDAVVVVDQDGNAVATGLGSAEVHVMAGSAADTADVTVTLDGSPVREWIAAGSGDWDDAANWSDNQVPGPDDVAMITAAGDYTVTLGGGVDVHGLVLGAGSGTQTLDTNGNTLRFATGGLLEGAELVVSSSVVLQGDVAWTGGTMWGAGEVVLESGAELHALGNPLELDADLVNRGTLTVGDGAVLRINESAECSPGSLVDLQGDASVVVQNNGAFDSSGTIRKSLGEEEASIVASALDESDFEFTGSLVVDAGSLRISGGSVSGRIDIAETASLNQAGNTRIPSANMRGAGPLVVGGRIDVGTYSNQIVNIPHLILDSASDPSISGAAGILVDEIFLWRRGSVAELRSLTTQVGSMTTFEAGGTKSLAGTNWNITGNVEAGSEVDLTVGGGAVVSVGFAGSWLQTAGGTVSQGLGDPGSFDVVGEFHKTGEGAFTVETGFTCSGTLDLTGGELTVTGDFSLFESGVITGGGTADLTYNRRLILVNASSAVMAGTIRPDLDGQPARLDIQGTVDLASTFTLELDVVTGGEFNTESVYFLTGGQVFGGTLALTAQAPADDGVDYKVVYASVASGEFAVTGDEQFDTVIQDGTGVLLRR